MDANRGGVNIEACGEGGGGGMTVEVVRKGKEPKGPIRNDNSCSTSTGVCQRPASLLRYRYTNNRRCSSSQQ